MQKAIETNATRSSILAQKLAKHAHQLRLRWLIAVSSLPLFGVLMAYAIAPQYADAPITQINFEEQLSLAPITNSESLSDNTQIWQTERVKRDDTVAQLCKRLNITETQAIDFLKVNLETKAFFGALKAGRSVTASTNLHGELLSLSFAADETHIVNVKRMATGLVAERLTASISTQDIIKSGTIKSSLFAATDDAEIPDSIAVKLAEIFSADIDFNSDLRKGDRFSVVYKMQIINGEAKNTDELLAAEFNNKGKVYRAVQYINAAGESNYFTPEGKSLNKSFLRSPVEFTRVSSGFTSGRFHPILNTMRAHKGVDLAAPTGTRVKAPGDGIVKFVGQKSGYGNVIMLSHEHGVTTVYGHLSGFVKGLRVGEKVVQSEVIGYVGMTGLATGPHLHYEFLINGEHHDPQTVALPKAAPVPANEMAGFNAISRTSIAQLNLLSNTNIAALD